MLGVGGIILDTREGLKAGLMMTVLQDDSLAEVPDGWGSKELDPLGKAHVEVVICRACYLHRVQTLVYLERLQEEVHSLDVGKDLGHLSSVTWWTSSYNCFRSSGWRGLSCLGFGGRHTRSEIVDELLVKC